MDCHDDLRREGSCDIMAPFFLGDNMAKMCGTRQKRPRKLLMPAARRHGWLLDGAS